MAAFACLFVSFNLGKGPAVIVSKQRVNMQQWNTVRAYRNGTNGLLVLNGVEVRGQAPSGLLNLNLDLNMYIGGMNNPTTRYASLCVSASLPILVPCVGHRWPSLSLSLCLSVCLSVSLSLSLSPSLPPSLLPSPSPSLSLSLSLSACFCLFIPYLLTNSHTNLLNACS